MRCARPARRVVLGARGTCSAATRSSSSTAAIYGKPPDEAAARATLSALGGRTHEVISGLACCSAEGARGWISERRWHAQRSASEGQLEELLDWYVATGEWRGRAGGYAIQGAGRRTRT